MSQSGRSARNVPGARRTGNGVALQTA
jgi:hypothetical protein